MKKFGIILLAILIGTILFEIISPPINPHWLKFVIEIIVIAIFGLIGLGVFKGIDEKAPQATSE